METDTLYKTMVLKLLDLSKDPLSTAVITDFFSEKNYTDYFTVQKAIFDLKAQALIMSKEEAARTYFSLTGEGKKTLIALSDRISREIISDIRDYLSEKKQEIKTDNSLAATYDSTVNGFIVRLTKTENGMRSIDINFPVPSKDAAETICFNWKSHSTEAIDSLYESLLR